MVAQLNMIIFQLQSRPQAGAWLASNVLSPPMELRDMADPMLHAWLFHYLTGLVYSELPNLQVMIFLIHHCLAVVVLHSALELNCIEQKSPINIIKVTLGFN